MAEPYPDPEPEGSEVADLTRRLAAYGLDTGTLAHLDAVRARLAGGDAPPNPLFEDLCTQPQDGGAVRAGEPPSAERCAGYLECLRSVPWTARALASRQRLGEACHRLKLEPSQLIASHAHYLTDALARLWPPGRPEHGLLGAAQ